jgi:hypothetical protein
MGLQPHRRPSIRGTVTDSTAAVVPQARVTARNLATNASRNSATDGSGSYRITSLTPGLYDVVIEKDGFKTVEFVQVELTVGQVQNLNPVLSPSAARETVTFRPNVELPDSTGALQPPRDSQPKPVTPATGSK